MGLGAGVGVSQSDGSLGGIAAGLTVGAIAGKAIGIGRSRLAEKAEEGVMRKVAEILLSTDRKALAGAAKQISKSRAMQKALDKIMDTLERSGQVTAIQQTTTPNK